MAIEINAYASVVTGGELELNYWKGIISGKVKLQEQAVDDALVILINSSRDRIENYLTTGAEGQFEFIVTNRDLYHLIVEYKNEGRVYSALSRPFLSPSPAGGD